MRTYCEENKGNRGMGASMFQANIQINEWNSFSATSNRCIKKGSIRQAVERMINDVEYVEKKYS